MPNSDRVNRGTTRLGARRAEKTKGLFLHLGWTSLARSSDLDFLCARVEHEAGEGKLL